jgi:hypothetical protein
MQNSKIEERKQSIDSIEAAISHLEAARDNGQLTLALGAPVLADLQMMRVARMLQLRAVERNAERDVQNDMSRIVRMVEIADRHVKYRRNNA